MNNAQIRLVEDIEAAIEASAKAMTQHSLELHLGMISVYDAARLKAIDGSLVRLDLFSANLKEDLKGLRSIGRNAARAAVMNMIDKNN